MSAFDAEDFVSWNEKDIRDSFLSMTKEHYVAIITFYKHNIILTASKDTAQKKALSVLQERGILLSFQLPQIISFEEQKRLDKLRMHAMELESKEKIELAKIKFLQQNKSTENKVDKELKHSTAFEHSKSDSFCRYCKSHNHSIENCFKLKRKQEIDNKDDSDYATKPEGILLTTNKPNYIHNDHDKECHDSKKSLDFNEPMVSNEVEHQCSPIIASTIIHTPSVNASESCKPFIYDGFVSLTMNDQLQTQVPITILRDTGASQSLLRAGILPLNDVSLVGNVFIKGVCSKDLLSLPLHCVYLNSDLVTGEVAVAVQDSFPMEGIDLLLGNDLAGAIVSSNSIVSKPSLKLDTNEEFIPELHSACDTTRSMTQILSTQKDSHLSSHHSSNHLSPDITNAESNTDNYQADDVHIENALFSKLSEANVDTYIHPAYTHPKHLSHHEQCTTETHFADKAVTNQADENNDTTLMFQEGMTPEKPEAAANYCMKNYPLPDVHIRPPQFLQIEIVVKSDPMPEEEASDLTLIPVETDSNGGTEASSRLSEARNVVPFAAQGIG